MINDTRPARGSKLTTYHLRFSVLTHRDGITVDVVSRCDPFQAAAAPPRFAWRAPRRAAASRQQGLTTLGNPCYGPLFPAGPDNVRQPMLWSPFSSARRERKSCQTLSGPLPQSGSPAREARGAAAAAPQGRLYFQREIGPQRQAKKKGTITWAQ